MRVSLLSIKTADVLPRKKESDKKEATQQETFCSVLILTEPRKKKVIELTSGGVIGRSGNIEQDFFAKDIHVSDEHCLITNEEGVWRVEHLSHTNPTCVNGKHLKNGFPIALKNGNLLTIADLFFKVSIETRKEKNPSVSKEQSEPQTHDNKETIEWEIVCPVCGKHYPVENSESRISECTGNCSFDEFDKYEIAAIKAQKVKR